MNVFASLSDGIQPRRSSADSRGDNVSLMEWEASTVFENVMEGVCSNLRNDRNRIPYLHYLHRVPSRAQRKKRRVWLLSHEVACATSVEIVREPLS